MAKPNKKGTKPVGKPAGKPIGKPNKGAKRGPSFNENALEQLTSKIDQNLNGKDNKRKKPPTTDAGSQDHKRQRNSSNGPSKPTQKSEQEALMDEIRALGGDEEDMKLIADIDSSDEEVVEGDKKPIDKSLKDELAAFSKQLGFSNHQPSEASEDENDQDDEAGQDEEDDDDFEDIEDDEEEGDDQDAEEDDEADEDDEVEAPRKVGNLNFEPRADWHVTKLPKLPNPASEQVGPFLGVIDDLKQHGKQLLDDDAAKYRSSVFAKASHKFLSTIMASGTLTDKVSALTLAIQESPVHNIRAFDALLALSSKKSRNQTIGAIGALVDLLGPGSVLPSNRRLRTFATQPGLVGTLQQTRTKQWKAGQPLPGKMNEMHLISWAYEEWLKDTYFRILQLLEALCSDEIEYSRSRALDFVYGLLKDKPEQESNLLRLLVNKLGDRDRKIASRASYLLLSLQTSHPGMKTIIVRMVEQEILLHPSQDHRSKYYAINTLNQTILSNREPAIADSLMRVYFELFVTLLKGGSLGASLQIDQDNPNPKGGKDGRPNFKPGRPPFKKDAAKPNEQDVEAADKLVSAILTGVNRAAPFVGENDTVMEKHMDTLFKIAHSANFNTGIQSLLLIQHLATARNLGTDRFYRTLYESLLDPRLVTSSKQSLYLNLLLRALKNDVDVRRVKAFAKRMLQISHLHQPAFVCGLLYVVAHLRGTFPDLGTLIQDPEESIFDDDSEQKPVYDGRKRDPEYSNAQRSCLWEMIPILAHYHPSVSVSVSALVNPEQKLMKPDLDSHSLIRFLDKFVYKSPKVADSARGVSIMQPLKATKDLGDIWLGSRAAGSAPTAVNSSSFRNKKADDVAAEDSFFHQYFQHVNKEPKKTKTPVAGGDGDEEDAAEDEIWKALVSAQPDIEGGDDDSEGFDDLDEDEMASDDDDDEDGGADLEDEDLSDDDMGIVDIETSDDEQDADADDLVAMESSEDEDKTAKDEKNAQRKAHRKKMKALPMFASVDDYADMLEQNDGEDF